MSKPDMEALFATLQPVPEDFEENCMKYALPAPIYYRRSKHYAECRCGACNALYMTDEVPKRGEQTKCRACGIEAEYAWMKETCKKRHYYTVVLIQRRTDGNLAMRHFKCINDYEQGLKRKFRMSEETRYMLNLGDFWKFNHQYKDSWSTQQNGITWSDFLYPGWEAEVANSNFKYCNPRYYAPAELKAFSRNPGMEIFQKIGLHQLAFELIRLEGRSKYINRRGASLKKQLRLKDKEHINFLIRNDGGITDLRLMQMEEKHGIKLTEEQRKWTVSVMSSWKGEEMLRHILKFMTFQKMYNRILKYEAQEKETRPYFTTHGTINRYDDYLTMREELGYDMTNEVYLFPRNLKEKHDEMVKERNARRDELHAQKQDAIYTKIPERYEALLREYGYSAAGLTIRPASCASEIITEGRTLHHCVGGDNYLRKHDKGQSYILFLRREDAPEQPYYTIEIMGDQVIQWYGIKDTKPDKDVIGPWLDRYVEHLQKKKLRAAV